MLLKITKKNSIYLKKKKISELKFEAWEEIGLFNTEYGYFNNYLGLRIFFSLALYIMQIWLIYVIKKEEAISTVQNVNGILVYLVWFGILLKV